MAATTEPRVLPQRRRAARSGPDRLSVILFSLAAFLVVLALLATQLRAHPLRSTPRQVVVLRRIYRTTVIETAPGRGSGTSVSQSVSSSGGGYSTSPAASTRSS